MKKASILYLLIFISLGSFSQKVKGYHSVTEALGDPIKVKSLDLSENDLIELPIEILQLKNLEDIDLEANPKLNFNQAINLLSQLKKIKILALGRNKLSNLPEDISKIKNLEYLSLEGNNFSQIPEPVKKLKITSLNLFDNQIKKLEIKKGDLINLIDINLCYNKFTVFPVELYLIPNLKQITIWHNNINLIPAEISRFKEIDSINIDNNELVKVPTQIAYLKTLRHLSIRFNRLRSDNINAIYNIESLTSLGLDGNKLTKIPNQITNLKKLKYLGIGHNPIKTLPSNFTELNELTILDFNSLHNLNWVNTFPLLKNLPKLQTIGMSDMALTKMPLGFEKLKQVHECWMVKNLFDKKEKARIKDLLPNTKIEF